jgi:hypothetical protein
MDIFRCTNRRHNQQLQESISNNIVLSFEDIMDLWSIRLSNEPPPFNLISVEVVKGEILVVSIDNNRVSIENAVKLFESFNNG